MGKLDIAERRLPQDGAINFKIGNKVVDLRLSILPTANNERIVMRILNKDAGDITLEQLNFEKQDLENLRKGIHSTQGLILVTGPTGSGKSTTLYSILKEVSRPHLNILTAEDPVEYELDGVGQVQIKDDIGFTFAKALRSFLRQDPEIILVGEMRDKETVDIGLKAALTGHLVFSTLHTNDAPSTITRLQNMGTPDYLISAACQLVVAQRLARKNCKDCRVPDDDVNSKVLKDMGFSDEDASKVKAIKGKGCAKCSDTGYKGRQGIYEILVVSKPIKEAILKQATTPELREIGIKEGFKTMQDMGRRMIASGEQVHVGLKVFDQNLNHINHSSISSFVKSRTPDAAHIELISAGALNLVHGLCRIIKPIEKICYVVHIEGIANRPLKIIVIRGRRFHLNLNSANRARQPRT